MLTSDRYRGSDSPKPSSNSHRTDDREKRDSSIPKPSIQSKDPTTASNINGTNGNSVEAKENRPISDQRSSSVTPTTTPEIVSILSCYTSTAKSNSPKNQSQAALDEEKKRKRMERLEQWKLKKAQEKAEAETKNKSASQIVQTDSKGSSSISPSDSGSFLRNNDTDKSLKKCLFKSLTCKFFETLF